MKQKTELYNEIESLLLWLLSSEMFKKQLTHTWFNLIIKEEKRTRINLNSHENVEWFVKTVISNGQDLAIGSLFLGSV